jgi:5,10-methylenetetrahydrofolate reductase
MKITDMSYEATGRPCFICDFSPARSGDPRQVDQAGIEADLIAVAYNPGRAVRANSVMLAAAIKNKLGKESSFTLATRDMNKLALESLLLGGQLFGLENVIVVQGDPFSQRDLGRTKEAGDVTPTRLIAEIAALNQGLDFRESNLRSPTGFCIGATVDLDRGLDNEAALAHRKARAGAHFLITQPIFDVHQAAAFEQTYETRFGESLNLPVFYGLQVLEQDGVIFSNVPDPVREALAGGKSGVEIALEHYQSFREAGLHNVYLVPPIRRGGARNYNAAKEFLSGVR